MYKTSIDEMSKAEFKKILDYTFLKNVGEYKNYKNGAKEGRKEAFHKFLSNTKKESPYAICLFPYDIDKAKNYPISQRIVSVSGFPYGNTHIDFKKEDIKLSIKHGANEIDLVLDYNNLNSPKYEREIHELYNIAKYSNENTLVKLIIETSELNSNQIKKACKLAKGADFIKTSTGFSSEENEQEKIEKIKIIRDNFSDGIKISGGINQDNYKPFLKAATGSDYVILNPKIIRIGSSKLK